MPFRFAGHVLDEQRRELTRAGEPIAIEPQVFDLLLLLLRRRDTVISRDELIETVWGGRIVSESTLASRINAARRAIGDSGEEQRLIRTLPKKGILFVGSVDEVHALPQASALRPAAERPAIAVLPFENLSGNREEGYFADGIVEEIITGLSRIKWLFVISRHSSSIYRDRSVGVRTIGAELGVRYVLEGSVRRAGTQLRLTGRLVETETATHVWAERYDGTFGDIFALQDALTMSVIGAIEPRLRRAEVERARRKRPENLDAYDLYLRALPFAGTAMPKDADRALELLEAAVRLEPGYAAAHGFIAWCHEQRFLRGGLDAGVRELARRHARLAIETGGDDALALAMGGFVVGVTERNYAVATEAIDRALALSPSSAIAFGFSALIRAWSGDYDRAIEHADIGIRLGPLDPLIYLPFTGLAYAHFFAGRYDAAEIAAGKAVAASPRFSVPRYLHAAALCRLGRLAEASAEAAVLLELQPGFTVAGLVAGGITTPERIAALAGSLREIGLPD